MSTVDIDTDTETTTASAEDTQQDTAVDAVEGVVDAKDTQEEEASLVDPLSAPLMDDGDSDDAVQFVVPPKPSLRSLKEDIHTLNPADRRSIRDDVLGIQLSRYRYKTTKDAVRLGFMIDDLPADSLAVEPDGKHVDLYSFTSMAVAALQTQQEEINALREELEALKATLKKG